MLQLPILALGKVLSSTHVVVARPFAHRARAPRINPRLKGANLRVYHGFLLEKCLVIVALVAASGCGSKRAPAFFSNPLPLLTWLGEFTRPAGTIYPQLIDSSKYGSLSGLAPDQGRKQWIGVIDDREHTRVAWLTIDFAPGRFEVLPVRMQELRAGAGIESRRVTEADLESIVALPNGTFVMGEEGHVRDGERVATGAAADDADGVVTHVIEYPKEFQITGDGKTGLRDNQGFEGLAVTPSGRLIAGLEQPLIQDGAVTFDRGGTGTADRVRASRDRRSARRGSGAT